MIKQSLISHKNKKLSVIIVSYNSEKFIGSCIDSVLKYLPKNSELLVIDNNSSDKTAQILEKYLPKIKLIKSDKNLGFAKANNLAVESTAGEYLFLLNPDTQVYSNVFELMIKFYESTVDVGIVAPKLVMSNGQTQPSAKNLPTIGRAFLEYVLGVKYAYSEYVPNSNQAQEVEVVYGAAMLIKNDLFKKLNGFDEKYFMYYEDADICKRVRELGKKVYYYPQVSIKHLVGATKSEVDKYKLNYQSFVKYHGPMKAFLFKLIFTVPRLRRRFS